MPCMTKHFAKLSSKKRPPQSFGKSKASPQGLSPRTSFGGHPDMNQSSKTSRQKRLAAKPSSPEPQQAGEKEKDFEMSPSMLQL